MPTNAASCATAPAMRSIRAARAASASGIGSCVIGAVQVRLQDQLRREFVANRASRSSGTPGVKPGFRGGGSVPLIDQLHGTREYTLQLLRKPPRPGGHV